MTLHTDLPIYKKGCDLVKLAFQVQQLMPRSFKRTLGEKITVHCTNMLDLMDWFAKAVDALAEKQTQKMNKRAEVEGELFPHPSPDMRKQLLKEEHGNNITTPGREPDQGGCNGAECADRLCGPGATPGLAT